MTERRKHIINLLMLSGSCVSISAAMVLFTSFGVNSDRNVKQLNITIEADEAGQKSFLDTTEIHRIISGSFSDGIIGQSIENTDLDDLERSFDANPFVRSAQLYIDKRDVLQVVVAERKPLLRVLSLKGANYYVDIDGFPMPLSENYTARVMVVTGHIPVINPGETVDSVKLMSRIFTIAKAIHADPFMKDFIGEIHVDHQGNILMKPLIGDFGIEINKTNDIEQKIENLKIFLKEGLSRVGWDKYTKLTIDYKNQIVAKKSLNP